MIGVFDSGLGGLGVLREMIPLMPGARIRFVADRANAPYGVRTLEEVRALTHDHASRLIEAGATTIVVACNTASAAALTTLREEFPETPFVGMEPAIKPAVAATKTGSIAVLATRATFQGRLFSSLIDEYASDVRVLTSAAPEWVEAVESGAIEGDVAEAMVRDRLQPLLDSGADVVVLGCTHFPFLLSTIRDVAGEAVTIIDPAAAVARRAVAIHTSPVTGQLDASVSGSIDDFEMMAEKLAGISFPGGVLPL
jgi:glutamate racemase